ncbi:Zinc finger RING/FYVE/PHD-type protein [Dioscorea alata]|uniref:Zinc finger RING/FYVE/PHD-type protein n=1 Tax=Dioscorea alata TaxID=55571 RepID=A0ACB7WJP9_DIOAL|nr:Zinc finger RING/FYVE/PHD-type protein [Dioscorea alata]
MGEAMCHHLLHHHCVERWCSDINVILNLNDGESRIEVFSWYLLLRWLRWWGKTLTVRDELVIPWLASSICMACTARPDHRASNHHSLCFHRIDCWSHEHSLLSRAKWAY